MKETEVLKLLPIEDRAKMEKKEIPTRITLSVISIGLGSGYLLVINLHLSDGTTCYRVLQLVW